jgi:cell wall-associated NlpC family hydrolase
MLADRGLRAASDRARATKATTVVAIAVVGSVVGISTPAASADRIAEKRAEANQVWNEIQAANVRLEKTIQLYDAAAIRLQQTQAAIKDNTERLAAAKRSLAGARKDLAGTLIAGYKSGRPDVLQTVLAARSLSQMLDEVDLVQRANSYNATVVGRVRTYKAEVVQRQHELAVQRTRRAAVVRLQADRKHQINSEIAAKGAIYRNLNESIKVLIREKVAAEKAAAEARARAAAQALAQAQAAQTPVAATGLGGAAGATASPSGTASSAQPTTNYTPPPASSVGAAAASAALAEQGVPYVWGGSSPSGFDCSGLVVWAYAQVGVGGLPHSSYALYNAGPHVAMSDLQPGDLVFFDGLGHVGIYIGGGNFVHAPHTGTVVQVSSLSGYYSANYVGAVRISG